jgi:outer membrane protein OmpA-like peptidoglycan-associated protein
MNSAARKISGERAFGGCKGMSLSLGCNLLVIARRSVLAATIAVAGCATPFYYPPVAQNRPSATPALSQHPDAPGQDWNGHFHQLALTTGTSPPSVEVESASPNPGYDQTAQISVVRLVFDESVFFDTDSDQPNPAAQPFLDMLAENIKRERPGMQLTVLGHTDAIGSDAYNMDLSRRRAMYVLQQLIDRGLKPDQLSTIAIGKRQPIATNETVEGRAMNRRVEFLISPSLPVNIGRVERVPVNAAYGATDDLDPTLRNKVEVLRPELGTAGYGLTSLGSIALANPMGLPPSRTAPAIRTASPSGFPHAQPNPVIPNRPEAKPFYAPNLPAPYFELKTPDANLQHSY